MIKSIEEIKEKLEEIEAIKATGKYKNWEEASKAAGMGKNWYFENIKKINREAKSIEPIHKEPVEIIKDSESVVKTLKESINNKKNKKGTFRVTITLSEKQHAYFKTKAEDRGMELAPLLSYGLGEAQDKGLI